MTFVSSRAIICLEVLLLHPRGAHSQCREAILGLHPICEALYAQLFAQADLRDGGPQAFPYLLVGKTRKIALSRRSLSRFVNVHRGRETRRNFDRTTILDMQLAG